MLSISDDVWTTRGHARAAAAKLRRGGHKAVVEQSGPTPPEYRVRIAHPTDSSLVAYVHEHDFTHRGCTLDRFDPEWIAK